MIVRFNEDLIPSYELTETETQEVEETGFTFDEDEGIGVLLIDGRYVVVKEFDEWDGLKLYRGVKNDK